MTPSSKGLNKLSASLFFSASSPNSTSLFRKFLATGSFGVPITVSSSSSWESEDTDGELLVDAGNAFNALYREATLWNARILWPRCSRFLFNTYRGYPQTFIRGSRFFNRCYKVYNFFDWFIYNIL